MNFNHVTPVKLEELTAKTTKEGRRYTTPEGNVYPSVTTVLSKLGKASIDAWRKRIGEEAADKISTQASIRGEAVHELCENYLNNDPDFKKGHMPANIQSFLQLKPILDEHVNNIHYLEAPLYSDYLKVAGRVDCVAEYDGELAIIDFKTSKKPKKESWIENYFMQESAYAVMYEERTEIPIVKLVTIIAVDGSETQVFVQNRDTHIKKFIEHRINYG